MVTWMELLVGFAAFMSFTLKLVLGDLVFAGGFRRKPRLALRTALSILVQSGISVVLYLALMRTGSWICSNTLYYLLLFILSALFLRLLFDEPMTELLLCAVGGYTLEHISTQIYVLLFYEQRRALEQGVATQLLVPSFLAQTGVFLAVAGLVWLAFLREARTAAPAEKSPVMQRRLLTLSVAALLVVLVLSSVRDRFAEESFHLMVITRLFSISSCLFLLYIRFDIVEKGRLEAEREEMGRIMALERKQFEQSRENIELINIKCHDMRHRIDGWERRGGGADREELAQIREMIGIYDSGIRTGNEVVDTILTERSLACEKAGIRMSCMVDGEKLSFLSTGDLCALFGNAVENAVEAAEKVSDPEERNVRIQARESRGMLVITVENSYVGEVVLEDGMPKTTKGDDGNHGFGVKSIRRVAEKYGGEMSIAADGIFHLTVLIPVPAQI